MARTNQNDYYFLYEHSAFPQYADDRINEFLLFEQLLPSLQIPASSSSFNASDVDGELLQRMLHVHITREFYWKLSLWSSPTHRLSQDIIMPVLRDGEEGQSKSLTRHLWTFSVSQLQRGSDIILFVDLMSKSSGLPLGNGAYKLKLQYSSYSRSMTGMQSTSAKASPPPAPAPLSSSTATGNPNRHSSVKELSPYQVEVLELRITSTNLITFHSCESSLTRQLCTFLPQLCFSYLERSGCEQILKELFSKFSIKIVFFRHWHRFMNPTVTLKSSSDTQHEARVHHIAPGKPNMIDGIASYNLAASLFRRIDRTLRSQPSLSMLSPHLLDDLSQAAPESWRCYVTLMDLQLTDDVLDLYESHNVIAVAHIGKSSTAETPPQRTYLGNINKKKGNFLEQVQLSTLTLNEMPMRGELMQCITIEIILVESVDTHPHLDANDTSFNHYTLCSGVLSNKGQVRNNNSNCDGMVLLSSGEYDVLLYTILPSETAVTKSRLRRTAQANSGLLGRALVKLNVHGLREFLCESDTISQNLDTKIVQYYGADVAVVEGKESVRSDTPSSIVELAVRPSRVVGCSTLLSVARYLSYCCHHLHMISNAGIPSLKTIQLLRSKCLNEMAETLICFDESLFASTIDAITVSIEVTTARESVLEADQGQIVGNKWMRHQLVQYLMNIEWGNIDDTMIVDAAAEETDVEQDDDLSAHPKTSNGKRPSSSSIIRESHSTAISHTGEYNGSGADTDHNRSHRALIMIGSLHDFFEDWLTSDTMSRLYCGDSIKQLSGDEDTASFVRKELLMDDANSNFWKSLRSSIVVLIILKDIFNNFRVTPHVEPNSSLDEEVCNVDYVLEMAHDLAITIMTWASQKLQALKEILTATAKDGMKGCDCHRIIVHFCSRVSLYVLSLLSLVEFDKGATSTMSSKLLDFIKSILDSPQYAIITRENKTKNKSLQIMRQYISRVLVGFITFCERHVILVGEMVTEEELNSNRTLLHVLNMISSSLASWYARDLVLGPSLLDGEKDILIATLVRLVKHLNDKVTFEVGEESLAILKTEKATDLLSTDTMAALDQALTQEAVVHGSHERSMSMSLGSRLNSPADLLEGKETLMFFRRNHLFLLVTQHALEAVFLIASYEKNNSISSTASIIGLCQVHRLYEQFHTNLLRIASRVLSTRLENLISFNFAAAEGIFDDLLKVKPTLLPALMAWIRFLSRWIRIMHKHRQLSMMVENDLEQRKEVVLALLCLTLFCHALMRGHSTASQQLTLEDIDDHLKPKWPYDLNCIVSGETAALSTAVFSEIDYPNHLLVKSIHGDWMEIMPLSASPSRFPAIDYKLDWYQSLSAVIDSVVYFQKLSMEKCAIILNKHQPSVATDAAPILHRKSEVVEQQNYWCKLCQYWSLLMIKCVWLKQLRSFDAIGSDLLALHSYDALVQIIMTMMDAVEKISSIIELSAPVMPQTASTASIYLIDTETSLINSIMEAYDFYATRNLNSGDNDTQCFRLALVQSLGSRLLDLLCVSKANSSPATASSELELLVPLKCDDNFSVQRSRKSTIVCRFYEQLLDKILHFIPLISISELRSFQSDYLLQLQSLKLFLAVRTHSNKTKQLLLNQSRHQAKRQKLMRKTFNDTLSTASLVNVAISNYQHVPLLLTGGSPSLQSMWKLIALLEKSIKETGSINGDHTPPLNATERLVTFDILAKQCSCASGYLEILKLLLLQTQSVASLPCGESPLFKGRSAEYEIRFLRRALQNFYDSGQWEIGLQLASDYLARNSSASTTYNKKSISKLSEEIIPSATQSRRLKTNLSSKFSMQRIPSNKSITGFNGDTSRSPLSRGVSNFSMMTIEEPLTPVSTKYGSLPSHSPATSSVNGSPFRSPQKRFLFDEADLRSPAATSATTCPPLPNSSTPSAKVGADCRMNISPQRISSIRSEFNRVIDRFETKIRDDKFLRLFSTYFALHFVSNEAWEGIISPSRRGSTGAYSAQEQLLQERLSMIPLEGYNISSMWLQEEQIQQIDARASATTQQAFEYWLLLRLDLAAGRACCSYYEDILASQREQTNVTMIQVGDSEVDSDSAERVHQYCRYSLIPPTSFHSIQTQMITAFPEFTMLTSHHNLDILQSAATSSVPKYMQLYRAYPADMVDMVHADATAAKFLPRRRHLRSLESSIGFADLHIRQEENGEDYESDDDDSRDVVTKAARAMHEQWCGVDNCQNRFYLYSWSAYDRGEVIKTEESDTAISRQALHVNPVTIDMRANVSDSEIEKKQFNALDIAPVALAAVCKEQSRDLIRSAIEVLYHDLIIAGRALSAIHTIKQLSAAELSNEPANDICNSDSIFFGAASLLYTMLTEPNASCVNFITIGSMIVAEQERLELDWQEKRKQAKRQYMRRLQEYEAKMEIFDAEEKRIAELPPYKQKTTQPQESSDRRVRPLKPAPLDLDQIKKKFNARPVHRRLQLLGVMHRQLDTMIQEMLRSMRAFVLKSTERPVEATVDDAREMAMRKGYKPNFAIAAVNEGRMKKLREDTTATGSIDDQRSLKLKLCLYLESQYAAIEVGPAL